MEKLGHKSTCELCGEPDVEMYASDALKEFCDGVACERCCSMHEDEVERRHEIDRQQRGDRLDDALADAFEHGDFD